MMCDGEEIYSPTECAAPVVEAGCELQSLICFCT